MKRIIFLLIGLVMLLFAGCSSAPEVSNDSDLSCGEYLNGESWMDDCNSCRCLNGNVACTKMACVDDRNGSLNLTENGFEDILSDIKFNTGLSDFEKDWLGYLEVKYPNSKIYYMRTKLFNCENCYELSYKKDLEVIKIKVLDGEKVSETKVIDDIAVEIENEDVCRLFKGNWNECPKLCSTDEVACQNECGLPVCEFDYNTIEYRKLGEGCGGLTYGDCEFGLKCYYGLQDDEFGVCQK